MGEVNINNKIQELYVGILLGASPSILSGYICSFYGALEKMVW